MEEAKEKLNKSITIDECTEGYNVKEGGTDNVYAVTKDSLIRKVKELLGITEKPKKKIPEKKDTPSIDTPITGVGWEGISGKNYIGPRNISEIRAVVESPVSDRAEAYQDHKRRLIKSGWSEEASHTLGGVVHNEPEPPTIRPVVLQATMSSIEPKINDDLKNNKVKIVVNKFPCEKFDTTNLLAKIAGKSTYWMSDEKVCIQREGYAVGLRVYVTLADLSYLYEHQDEIKNVSKTRRYHITGFLKDVDVSTLSGSDVSTLSGSAAEIKEPEQEPDEPESEEPEEEPKPKLEFFHEDTGFDYMAVQPKQVGRTQVYANSNGKMVIKVAREIVLTTQDMVEKLLQYDEKDLTASLRGINSQKQNIMRVYLIELKKRTEASR